ncbi:hypothetical protein [Sphingobacterium luzhongxinii]|uniref:hypothetical protein n=1 Tax=Sphingobacterium luzhongxinii TaxID=2654181 RepID=UPI0013DBE986|nr:hypothetical protein [Sphingobacterium sp. xlx-73]
MNSKTSCSEFFKSIEKQFKTLKNETFFRGGEGLSCGQSDKDLSSRPIEQNNRLSTMSPSGLLIREAHRNDERGGRAQCR